jgi:hypothetical protein
LSLVILAELLVTANSKVTLGTLEARQMEMTEAWHRFALPLNPFLAALAHIVLRKLAGSGLVLRNLGVVHALHVNRLAVTEAVLCRANGLPAVGAHDALLVEEKILAAIALQLADIVSALKRLSAPAANFAVG